jgi:hypothetical protein
MGVPYRCRAVVFGDLLALSGWKERNCAVIAASVQWILQKLKSSKNRLIHQVHTSNKGMYILDTPPVWLGVILSVLSANG